jgi:hypothetical protein
VLHRANAAGVPVVTITFTLIDSTPQPDANYRLRGHLDPTALMLTPRHHPERRDAVIEGFFRPGTSRPMPMPMPMPKPPRKPPA